MSYEFSVRAEDFREAWANAYQTAVLQVVEMHKRADFQLKVSYTLSKITAENSELSRTRLLETAKIILQNSDEVCKHHEKLISSATGKLLEQVNQSKVQDTQLRTQMMELIQQLSNECTKLEQARALHFNQSLWRRLWSAIQNSR